MSIQQRRAAMAKIEENAGFYKKMAELQEKLRRSEEERLKLEEKFTMMMKSCREDEEARIRALRERYEKFLEDDKRRHERNERIMQTLEKIESRAAILSAKTERLKLLRKHYEAYLIRMYPVWKNQVGYSVEKRFANQVGVLQKPDTKIVMSDLTAPPSNLHNMVPSALPFYPPNLLSPLDSKAQLPGMYQQYGISPRIQDPGLYLNLESLRSPGRPVAVAPVKSEIPATVPKFTYNVEDPKGLTVNGTTGVGDDTIKNLPSVDNKMNNHSLLQPNKVDRPLTDYIERAAELLEVPVEKAKEAYDEKKDEGKSTLGQDNVSKVGYSMDNEPEQNTSRDLLNISLSDDGVLEEEVSKIVPGQTLKGSEIDSHAFVDSSPQSQEENGYFVMKKQLLPPTDGRGDAENIAQPVKENQNQHLPVEHGQGDANEAVVRKQDSELIATNIKNIGYEDGRIELSQSKEAIAGPNYVPDSQAEVANTVQNTTLEENILEQRIADSNWQDQQNVEELLDYNQSKIAEYKERIEQEKESVSNEKIREELVENNQPKTDDYKERIEQQEEPVSNEKFNDWQQQESEAEAWQQDNPSQFNISWKQQQEEFGEIAKDQKNMFNESYTEHRVVAEDQLQETENNEYWQQQGNLQPEVGDFGQGNIYENQEYNENWQQENLAQEQVNYPLEYDSNTQQELGSENNWPQHNQNEQPAVYDPNLPQYSSENMQEGEYTANWPLQEDNTEQQVQYITNQGEEWQQQQPYESDNPQVQYQEEELQTWQQQQQQSDNAEQQQEELYEDNFPEEWEQQPSNDEQGKGTRLYGDTSLHRRDIIFEEDEFSDHQQEDDAVQLVSQDNIMQSTPQETPSGIQPKGTQQEQTLDRKLYLTEEIKESDESLAELQNHQQPTIAAHELKRQLIDDPSESSSDSRPEQNPSIHPTNTGTSEGTVEQYRNLLGVAAESHSDTGGYSDIDDVEDQLAALVEQSTDRVLHGTEIQGESKPSHVLDESSRHNELPSVTKPNPIKTEELKSKNEISSEHSGVKLGKGSSVVDGSKPLPRPVAKKLPGLTKVLESDSESLHLDTTGGSNIDSDEFDFSSEQ